MLKFIVPALLLLVDTAGHATQKPSVKSVSPDMQRVHGTVYDRNHSPVGEFETEVVMVKDGHVMFRGDGDKVHLVQRGYTVVIRVKPPTPPV